jgi:hypothetical protein
LNTNPLANVYTHIPDCDTSTTYSLAIAEPLDAIDRPRAPLAAFAKAKKKYKPVAKKVRPTLADLPERFCIVRNITGEPLKSIPPLTVHPPPFKPTG